MIREQLTAKAVQPPLKLTFLELQANHAFIRCAPRGSSLSPLSVCMRLLLTLLRVRGPQRRDVQGEVVRCPSRLSLTPHSSSLTGSLRRGHRKGVLRAAARDVHARPGARPRRARRGGEGGRQARVLREVGARVRGTAGSVRGMTRAASVRTRRESAGGSRREQSRAALRGPRQVDLLTPLSPESDWASLACASLRQV